MRTSPGNLAEIKSLLNTLDKAPRRLNISVMQNVDGETVRRLTQISGSMGAGQARIGIGSKSAADSSSLQVTAGQGADRLHARISSTRELEGDNKSQQIQVLEGSQALVSAGQSIAVPQRQVVQSPWHTRWSKAASIVT